MNLAGLETGDVLTIPNGSSSQPAVRATMIEIDFATKTIRPFDRSGRPVGFFHCSIARERSQRPAGNCKVAGITKNPKYLFKPESWPEVKGIRERLLIPPGPRNPVGLCWIGLTLKGYGVHGTPAPELIGKTGSHGCIRLTNWDVLRLATMIRPGAEVRFVDRSARLAAGGYHGDREDDAPRRRID